MSIKKVISVLVFVIMVLGLYVDPVRVCAASDEWMYASSNEDSSLAACFPTPVKTIALKSNTNGCYVTCDVGVKNASGRYPDGYDRTNPLDWDKPRMGEPHITVTANKADFYEMFELVPCAAVEDIFAIRSAVNRKYLTYIFFEGLKISADFINSDEYIEVIRDGSGVKLKFTETNKYICVKDNKLAVTDSQVEGEWFRMEVINENYYSTEEIKILGSDQWFNIMEYGVGYWDIQNDIGKDKSKNENTKSLEKLGYKMMYRNDRWDRKTIEYDNMQCAVGVKKLYDGTYDIIVTFQGTGGFYDECKDNDARDGLSNTTGYVLSTFSNPQGMHEGYYQMAKKLADHESDVVIELDKEYTLKYFAEEASEGRANFTILGHSMGGAIAQCYAKHLNKDYGIDRSQIKGRTFNSALAIDHDEAGWTKWINLCVYTDTVPNGLVPGSIINYGIHRLGRTIWIYDSLNRHGRIQRDA